MTAVAFSASALLGVWERGAAEGPLARALTLARAAAPDAAGIEALPIGTRDALLLAAREASFGARLECTATCPSCADVLAVTLDTAALRRAAPAAPVTRDSAGSLEHAGWRITFRLPTTLDLLAVSATADGAAAWRLAERCVVRVEPPAGIEPGGALPEAVLAALGDAVAAADPLGAPRLALRCATCGHGWDADFDIVSHLWGEVAVHARRLLDDVHAIAAAYGWREAEILALAPARRRAYLERIRA
jgi:hypothetical protein